MAIAIDPICLMEVDTEDPPGGKSEYQGTAYYFCAPGCKVAFDRDPEKYLTHPAEGLFQEPHQHQPPERKPSFLARLFGKK